MPNRQTIKTGNLLYYWVLGTVFIVPLLIFNYGYNASIIRQLVLLVLVIVGLLIWVSRTVLFKQPLAWQRSVFNLLALILLAAVLVTALLVPDLQQVWGLRGVLGESNPWGWLAVIGLGVLITQVVGRRKQNFGITEFRQFSKNPLTEPLKFRNSVPLLTTYLFSSTLLALFVIVWWLFRQELVMPALTSFAAASLFFTVNAIVIAALSLPAPGKIKLFWLAILLVHLAVIFAYDYDVAWYVLAGAMLVLSVAQLVWEKKLSAASVVDFRIPFALIVISLGLLFAPVQSLSNKLGFAADSLSSVGAQVAYPRFFKYSGLKEILLGHGLGQGAESFWEQAELVDMSQVRQFPPLGWGFSYWLWEGGLLMLLVFLGVLVGIWRAAWRNLPLALPAVFGLAGYFVMLLLLPFDWLGLFGLIIFMAVLAAAGAERPVRNHPLTPPWKGGEFLTQGERSFMSFGSLALAGFLILLIIAASRQISSRLDFFRSITVQGQAGTTVDLKKLDNAIARQPRVWGYRLARVDFMVQALGEAAASGQEVKEGEIKPWLETLVKDYDWLERESISGPAAWQLARGAISAGRQGGPALAGDWLKRAIASYQRAIETLPRNVILFTEVAQFYRLNAPTMAGQEPSDPYYKEANALLDKAITIDNTFQPALMERAELLLLAGKPDEALESVKQVARDNPAAAYSAGRLAFSAKKFDEAVDYYKQAIGANPNHLQARYELVQAYMALSDFKSADSELDELDKRAPADDTATQQLLKGLRELLK